MGSVNHYVRIAFILCALVGISEKATGRQVPLLRLPEGKRGKKPFQTFSQWNRSGNEWQSAAIAKSQNLPSRKRPYEPIFFRIK